MNIAVLVSGNLGLKALEHFLQTKQVVCVLTDENSDEIIDKCKTQGLPVFAGNPRAGRGAKFMKNYDVEIIFSVNYLFIIEPDLFNLAKVAVNIHGSLLPKYRGRTPHVWAIINNEKVTGITAHLIDDGCDTGDVIEQMEVPIGHNDTGADVLSKYINLYNELIDKVLQGYEQNSWTLTPQDHTKATMFGKRTPADGKIIWSWHKERIRNWVRAQSKPYPGAFSFLNGDKITIDWVEFSDIGFDASVSNGTVLSTNPPTVKTPNGALELVSLRNQPKKLEVGYQFESKCR